MSEQQAENSADKIIWHRVKFLALIGVFLSPFIAGWMALYVFDIKPTAGNYGSLVSPVRKLDWPELETHDGEILSGGFGRKWTLLMFANDGCGELCQSNLFYMRQLRTLLGRDTPRLQNVLVSSRPLTVEMKRILDEYPGFKVIENNHDPALYVCLSWMATLTWARSRACIWLTPPRI